VHKIDLVDFVGRVSSSVPEIDRSKLALDAIADFLYLSQLLFAAIVCQLDRSVAKLGPRCLAHG
jgi:hypothetical protein